MLEPRAGSVAFKLGELAKRIAYRSKWLNFLTRPRFPLFGMQPAQLAWLVSKMDETRKENKKPGAIVEVGVGIGMTTIFLLEHMKLSQDSRPYYCIDTFGGFLDKDLAFEEKDRGKRRLDMEGRFAYNKKEVFENNLKKAGYSNQVVVCADASTMDFSKIGPIDVMLLDVDLYLPTKAVLSTVPKFLNDRAYIMVDDCQSNSLWDGSDQAYMEFIQSQGGARVIVGTKGGVFEKVSG
jgi:predicted O-methyltransferase YrrM